MIRFSHQNFGGFFRGVIRQANLFRYTLKRFEAGEDAELYSLSLMMRFRSIFKK